MSYRCKLCSTLVHGISQIKLVTKVREIDYTVTGGANDRHVTGREIAQEISICPECKKLYGEDFKPQVIARLERTVQAKIRRDDDSRGGERGYRDWEEDNY